MNIISKDSSELAKAKCNVLSELLLALNNSNRDIFFVYIEQWKKRYSNYQGMSNWDLIREQRYQGCFSFLNGARTESEKIIDTLRDLPRLK